MQLTSRESRPDGPVMAIVEASSPSPAVLQRAEAAAAALACPLHILVLEPRLGFTTSVRLVGYALRRAELSWQRCCRMIAETLPAREGVTITRMGLSGISQPKAEWRAVAAAVNQVDARLVVAPDHLRHHRMDQVSVEVLLVSAEPARPQGHARQ